MAERCALSTGNLLGGGLPRNSVDRITDRPDMTSAVYRGRKASTQTNIQSCDVICNNCLRMVMLLKCANFGIFPDFPDSSYK